MRETPAPFSSFAMIETWNPHEGYANEMMPNVCLLLLLYIFKNVCGDRILPISRVFCYNNIGQSANKCPENGKTLNAFKKKIIELKHTN